MNDCRRDHAKGAIIRRQLDTGILGREMSVFAEIVVIATNFTELMVSFRLLRPSSLLRVPLGIENQAPPLASLGSRSNRTYE